MRSSLVGCLVLMAVSAAPVVGEPVVGGWSKVSVKDEGVVAAAAFAITARRAAVEKDGDGKLALVEIVDAEQQVVAGMNYRLTMRVKSGDATRKVEAIVWARVWLDENERYELTAWRTIDEPARPGPPNRR